MVFSFVFFTTHPGTRPHTRTRIYTRPYVHPYPHTPGYIPVRTPGRETISCKNGVNLRYKRFSALTTYCKSFSLLQTIVGDFRAVTGDISAIHQPALSPPTNTFSHFFVFFYGWYVTNGNHLHTLPSAGMFYCGKPTEKSQVFPEKVLASVCVLVDNMISSIVYTCYAVALFDKYKASTDTHARALFAC